MIFGREEGFTFNEILAQVDVGQLEPEKIAGIIYRAADGGLQMTAERSFSGEEEVSKRDDRRHHCFWRQFPDARC